MRTIFINRFYWPDEPATAQLLADLAERLALRGQQIVVIASQAPATGVPRVETRNGVLVQRVRSWRSGSGVLGKLLGFVTFFILGTCKLLGTVQRADVVVCLTDPPLLSIPAALVCRLRGARLIHWVQDIYPEVATAVTGKTWLGRLRPLRNFAWRASERCVTLGTDMAEVPLAAGVPLDRISLIPNWSPDRLGLPSEETVKAIRNTWGLAGKFVVEYSGNLGRVHELTPILAVAQLLAQDPAIIFVFVGGGAQKASLEAASGRLALRNVLFKAPQTRNVLAESLGAGDIHLVTLKAGCEHYVFPSKLYGILAVGRPVIFIGPTDSEIAQIIDNNNLGKSFSTDQASAIAAFIQRLRKDPTQLEAYALSARKFHAALGGPEKAADAWNLLLTPPALAGDQKAR